MDQVDVSVVEVPPNLRRNWGWFLAFGMCLGTFGILSIVNSLTANGASMDFYGAMLVAAAATEGASGVLMGRWRSGAFLHLVGVLLLGVTGYLLLRYPTGSVESITLLMAAFFVIGGAFEVIAPFFMSMPGRGWHMLNGATAVTFGILVFAQWPFSALSAIGTYIGIDLLFRGLSSAAFAIGLRLAGYGSTSQTNPKVGGY